MQTNLEVIVDVFLKPNDVYTPFHWNRGNLARWVSAGVLCLIFRDLYARSSEALRSFEGGQSILAITVLLATFTLLALLLFPYLRVLALFRKSPALKKTRRLTFRPAGIKIESEDTNSDCKWTLFQRVYETRALFVFMYTAWSAMYLPKRCFASQEEIVRLREIISENFKGKWQLRRD